VSQSQSQGTERAREMYDAHRFGGVVEQERRERFYSLLIDFVKRVGPDDKLYDVGCGRGTWIETYHRHSPVRRENVVCVDLAPANVAAMRERGYEAHQTSVLDLDLPDACSDFTLCQGVIQVTPDPFRGFQELVRITKPGGLIFCNVYNFWNPYFWAVYWLPAPIRWLHWNVSPWASEPFYQVSKLLMQPAARVLGGAWLTETQARTFFMDQVITPNCYLHTKRQLRRYAREAGVEVEALRFQLYAMMLAGIFRKPR